MKTGTFLIAVSVFLCHTCSRIGANVEIGILAVPYEINEPENTTNLAIYVSLLYGTPNETIAVELHTANGNAIGNIDYAKEDAAVKFNSNSTVGTTMCSYITILGNSAVQDTKNFTAYITSNSSGVFIPSYAQVVSVQIFGGITQHIDVSFNSSTYSVHENQGYVHLCIEITSGLLQRAANVYLSSLDGTAFNLTHYLPLQNAKLTFLSGDQTNSTRCINVTVFDDMITGDTKFFTVSLTAYDINVHVTTPNATIISIEDSDYVTVSLTENAYNTSESVGYVMMCAKILIGTLGRSITVYASTRFGTATGENFLEVQSYPLPFMSGTRQNDTSCFNITVIDDMITENTNYFTVYITSNGTGIRLTTPINATVSIADNNYITVRFTLPIVVTNESARFAMVCVEIMTGVLGRNASVYLNTIDGTAIGTTNYSPVQHMEVRFVENDTTNSTQCISIIILDDMITEDTNYFNASITTYDAGVILVEPKTCIIAVMNSDYVIVSFTTSTFNTTESAGYARVCTRIIAGILGRSIMVYVTSKNGTATERDFIEVQSYPVIFTAGKRQNDTTCFNITVIDDKVTEDMNFFTVQLTSNDTGVQLGSPVNATVLILDSNYITIRFTSATFVVNESTQYATVCIIIQEGFLDRSAIVYVSTMDGTAINSTNYSPLRYSEVQFFNGDGKNTTRCINITVFDDMIVEDAKDFRVSLTINDSGVRAVSPSTTTVIILDTNFLLVSFTANTYNSSEREGYATVCAKIIMGIVGRPLWVHASTMNGTATDQNFIQVQSYPLVFTSGRKQNDTVCLNITVIDDMITGNTNYFTVTLTTNDTAVQLMTPFNATAFISDSDYLQVSLEANTYNSSESMGYVTICAKIITGTLGRSAIVYHSTKSGTATDMDFIQVYNYPTLFVNGNRQNDTSCFNITIIDDLITESTSYFTVYIMTDDPGVHLITPSNATVLVADNDYILVGFSSPTYTTDGSAEYVQVCAEILQGALGKSVSVYLTSINDTAIIGEDYYSVEVELVFSTGQEQNDTLCANITVLDDMITDGAQKLIVFLYSNTTAVQLAEPRNATIIIDDINYVTVSLTSSIYNTSESEEYLDVCAIILSGYLKIPVLAYISASGGTANDFTPIKDMKLWFYPDDTQNDTSCANITIIHDMLTEMTQKFSVFLSSNHSSVKLVPPTNATVFITDIDFIEVGFNQSMYSGNAHSRIQVCIQIYSGQLNATVNLGTYINGTSTAFSQINFTLLSGDRNGTIHCENTSLLPGAVTGTTQQYNVTLFQLTADITVHFKQRSTIISISNPASNQLTAADVAAISTGIISIIIIFFILILIIYMLICTSMVKKAAVKMNNNSQSSLYFPLKPEYASHKGLKRNQENEMLEMKTLDISIIIKNETVY